MDGLFVKDVINVIGQPHCRAFIEIVTWLVPEQVWLDTMAM